MTDMTAGECPPHAAFARARQVLAMLRLGGDPERRTHDEQRRAIDRFVARARGEVGMMRGANGSVFVYDEQRDTRRTVRALVLPSGEVEIDTFQR